MKAHNTLFILIVLSVLLVGPAAASHVVLDVKGEVTDKYIGNSGTSYVCMHTPGGQYNALPINYVIYGRVRIGNNYEYKVVEYKNGLRSVSMEPILHYPSFFLKY